MTTPKLVLGSAVASAVTYSFKGDTPGFRSWTEDRALRYIVLPALIAACRDRVA